MGAAASVPSKEGEGSVFEALKAQEETKTFYRKRIAEVIVKDFQKLKDKEHLSSEEFQKAVEDVLLLNEPFILEKGLMLAPPQQQTQTTIGLNPKSLVKKQSSGAHKSNNKSLRRKSFDNLAYEDIAHFSPRRDCSPLVSSIKGQPQTDVAVSSVSSSPRMRSFIDENGEYISSTNSDATSFFKKLCNNSVSNITSKRNLTLMAAVDGSDGGHMAFQTMMLMKKRLDHVCLFHAYNKGTDHKLPEEFQADAVRARYENELIHKLHLPSTKFSFFWEENKSKDIRKVITHMLNEYKGLRNPMRPTRNEPNFFFVGYTGKKGIKEKASTLGSVTDIALRSVHMPVIICKNVCSSSSRMFVIAVDGSENSRIGFEIAMALMNPRDTLHCITVTKQTSSTESKGDSKGGDDEDEEGNDLHAKAMEILSSQIDAAKEHGLSMSVDGIRNYYTTELENYGPAVSEFIHLTCSDGQSVAERLVEYSDSVKADFFAISPRSHMVFTSVTEYVITNANANIILCKV